jgi:hypothetical protein
MWPSLGDRKWKTPEMAPGSSAFGVPKGLFFGLFRFSVGLITGPLLERGTKNVAE